MTEKAVIDESTDRVLGYGVDDLVMFSSMMWGRMLSEPVTIIYIRKGVCRELKLEMDM